MPAQTLSRAAAVMAGLLAAAQGYQALLHFEGIVYLAVLTGFAGSLGLFAAARMWWLDCIDCRLVTAALALSALLGHLFVSAVGLPGQSPPDQVPPSAALVVILAAATLLLVTLDLRSRLRLGREA